MSMRATALLLLGVLAAGPATAQEFTVLHTNDWQSRLLGFGPNAEYSPDTVDDDDTVGGVARLATLIAERRAAAGPAVLVLDGGDFTMGSLFHLITRETGAELQLMTMLGYDATTIGNHELDFRPAGLAQMIGSARAAGPLPVLLATNLVTSSADPRDDGLEALFADGTLVRSHLVERGGVTFGLLGILGVDAFEVIGQAEPLAIEEPVAALTAGATRLREGGADVVIVLSHSGVRRQADGSWGDEDVEYLAAVPGVDLIVSGHSHTALAEPILVDGRPVVQAGSEAQYLGELVMELGDGGVRVVDYTLHPVDDRIAGDPQVTAFVASLKEDVSARVLAPQGYRFDQPVAETPRDLTRAFDDHVLGNLVTDGIRVATGADIAVSGNGTIRDDVVRGRTGVQWVSDLFRVQPLGIGTVDDTPGYALQVSWFTGRDLKSLLEFLLVGYQLKGANYYPRTSGVQVVYNNNRVLFDRIAEVRLGNDTAGYTAIDLSDDRLYSVATTTYVGSFLPTVKKSSFGILDAVPRDADGNPVSDIDTLVFDADPSAPGVQEIKSWRALMDHVARLPDTDGDGLPDIPVSGAAAEARLIRADSWSPGMLYGNATWRMWGASVCPLVAVGGLVGGAVWWRRRRS